MSLPKLRVFVSSPGDVDTERKIAARVIARLAGEFRGCLELDAYFWEDEPMVQQRTFQAQIPHTSEFDLVLCILWSRLGTPLTGPDGKTYPSGTDYEVETARAAYEQTGRPELMIYLNQTPAQLRQLPREERERMLRQWEALESFVERHCVEQASGVIKGAFTTYRDLGQFEDQLEKHLRKFLLTRLPADESTDDGHAVRGAEITWRGCPYRGLHVFDFEQAPVFFGRTRATGEVLALLRQRALRLEEARTAAINGLADGIDPAAATFVLVCAMSGVGKSSLVRAGVLPLLAQPGGGIGLWRRVVLRPSETPAGGDLFDALAQELTKPDGLPELLGGGVTPRELAFMLRQHPHGVELLLQQSLGQAAQNVRAANAARLMEEIRRCRDAGRTHDVERLELLRENERAPAARLVVVIDQMEELFTLEGINADLRRRYTQVLAALARSGWAWVIGTLRSDFFGRCAEIPELMELKAQGLYDLQPPTPDELGQMIRRPAQAAGLRFERRASDDAALDETLRDVAAGAPEALPLLGFALEQLYDQRDADGVLTWQAHEKMGGLEGALRQRAEEVFGGLCDWQQAAFDPVMRAVTTVDLEKEGVFNRRWADTARLAASHAGAGAFVDAFLAAETRLFVAGHTDDAHAVVSVAHEALLTAWPRLRDWLKANRENLLTRAQLAVAAAQWRREACDAGYLLPAGLQLAKAEELMARHPDALGRDEAEYIAASTRAVRARDEAERQRERETLLALQQSAHRAIHARSEAEKLIDFMLLDLNARLAPIGRLDLFNELSRRAITYYESFNGEEEQPEARRRRRLALHQHGDTLQAQGLLDDAFQAHGVGRAIAEQLAAQHPEQIGFRHEFAVSLYKTADVLVAQGNFAQALPLCSQALAIFQSLAQGQSTEAVYQNGLVDGHRQLGAVLAGQRRWPEALVACRQARDLCRQLVAVRVGDAGWQRQLAATEDRVGETLAALGNFPGAQQAFLAAQAIRQRLADHAPADESIRVDLCTSRRNLIDVMLAQNDAASAFLLSRTDMETCERESIRSSGPAGRPREESGQDGEGNSRHIAWQRELASAEAKMAEVLSSQGDLSGVVRGYGTGSRDSGEWLGDLGGALRAARRAEQIRRQLLARDPNRADSLHDLAASERLLGKILHQQGHLDAGLQAYLQGLDLCLRLATRDPNNMLWQRELARGYHRVGAAWALLNRVAEAVPALQKAINHYHQLVARDPADLVQRLTLVKVLNELVEVFLIQENSRDALAIFQEMLSIREAIAQAEPGDAVQAFEVASLYYRSGLVQAASGDTAQAIRSYRRGHQLLETVPAAFSGDAKQTQRLGLLRTRLAEVMARTRADGG